MIELEFASRFIAERALLFCCSAMSQLKVVLVARELSATRSGVLILLMNEVLLLCRTYMNERITMQSSDTRPVEMERSTARFWRRPLRRKAAKLQREGLRVRELSRGRRRKEGVERRRVEEGMQVGWRIGGGRGRRAGSGGWRRGGPGRRGWQTWWMQSGEGSRVRAGA